MKIPYTFHKAYQASLAYFEGDELAADVFASKYALRDLDGGLREKTPTDTHRRMAREFARIEANYPNAMSEDEIFGHFDDWTIVPQGSPMSAIGNPFQAMSASNCFVIPSPHDSYAGILRTDQEQVQLMKRRGGVGFDLSTLRPKNCAVANAARSTDGIKIFMERYSNTCREVAQNGRRGALMLSCSIHHPDIADFITAKIDRTKVTGANISVRLSDEFLRAVEADSTYTQRFPVDPSEPALIEREVPAREVWDLLVQTARDTSEPGVLFWDTFLRESPADCYAAFGFRTVGTNPCFVAGTLVATAEGPQRIEDLCGKRTVIWDGLRWVENGAFRVTGRNQKVVRIVLADGSYETVTLTHTCVLADGSRVLVSELRPGDRLKISEAPLRHGQGSEAGVYAKGFIACREEELPREAFRWRLETKAEFVAGLFDAGGAALDSANGFSYQLSSTRRPLLASAQLLLKTMGVRSTLGPTRGGADGMQDCWRLTVSQEDAIELARLVPFRQLTSFANREVRYRLKPQWNRVVAIEDAGVADEVYCTTVSSTSTFALSSGNDWGNCAEIGMCEDDSCRLLAITLCRFVQNAFTSSATYDFEALEAAAYKAQKLLDDLVDLEIECVDRIISKVGADPEPAEVKRTELELWRRIRDKAIRGRRTGLGITALGDAIAYMGLKYGSPESIELADKIYRSLALGSYRASVDMARDRGAFPIWDLEAERGHPFIGRVLAEDPQLAAAYARHGRRNIANLTTAPTGSLSILTQTTSGCEPVLFLDAERKRKVNADDPNARIDFVDEKGDCWQKYRVSHHGVAKWREVTGLEDSALSPYHGATVEEIDWRSKIDMQAAAQKWIDHSISNTTNFPRDVAPETVGALYLRAWKTGCKGATIYRVGSRDAVIEKVEAGAQNGTASEDARPDQWIGGENHAPKRPNVLPCDLHTVSVKGVKYAVIIGMLNDRPYEIFAGRADKLGLPAGFVAAYMQKRKVGNRKQAAYNLHGMVGDVPQIVHDVSAAFDEPVYGAFSRTVSLVLRHGCPVQYLVEQLKKDKHSTITSFEAAVARVLSKSYIPDGARPAAQKTCEACGSASIAYQEGCLLCVDCGSSKCG